MAKKASKAVAPAKAEVAAQPETQAPAPESAPETVASTETDMACCGNPSGPTPFEGVSDPRSLIGNSTAGYVLMKFVHTNTSLFAAPVLYLGLYSGCIDCPPVLVNPSDVERLEQTGVWFRVEAVE